MHSQQPSILSSVVWGVQVAQKVEEMTSVVQGLQATCTELQSRATTLEQREAEWKQKEDAWQNRQADWKKSMVAQAEKHAAAMAAQKAKYKKVYGLWRQATTDNTAVRPLWL